MQSEQAPAPSLPHPQQHVVWMPTPPQPPRSTGHTALLVVVLVLLVVNLALTGYVFFVVREVVETINLWLGE